MSRSVRTTREMTARAERPVGETIEVESSRGTAATYDVVSHLSLGTTKRESRLIYVVISTNDRGFYRVAVN
jgi:hypothetical protein